MNYSTDKAITSSEDDLLGRASFSRQIGKAIYEYKGKDSLVIGLYGKWGTGKTSVINMSLQEIKYLSKNDEKKPMIVRFAPWNYSDKDNLISQFLNTLKAKIGKDDNDNLKKVGEALNEYSEAFNALSIIPIIGPFLAPLLQETAKASGRYLSKPMDLYTSKENLSKGLLAANQKIVVLIDDIDRLTNLQIRDIFQLVKQVGDLPNIIYILVMDKDVVENALTDVHGPYADGYLEKIVQIPFEVPSLDKTKLHKIFFRKLDQVLTEIPDDIAFDKQYWYKIFHNCVEPYICTLRDVNRVINIFQFKYFTLYRETSFEDMVGITTIEVLEPKLYKWVSNNKEIVCGGPLHSIITSGVKPKDFKACYFSEFEELGINAEKAIKCISSLFPAFAKDVGEPYYGIDQDGDIRRKMRVAEEGRFNLYFMMDLESITVSRGVINELIYTLDRDNSLRLIKGINKSGDIVYFLQELRAMIQNIPYTRVGLLASLLIDIANTLNGETSEELLPIPASQLAEYLSSALIKRFKTNEERYAFLLNVIQHSGSRNIGTIAQELNEIELTCNRAVENTMTEDKPLLTDVQLENLKQEFLKKVQEVNDTESLIELDDFYIVFYLWKRLDKDAAETCLLSLIKSDKNKLKYICRNAVQWHGAEGNGWGFDNKRYSDYISEEEIFHLIQNYGRNHLNLFTKLERIQLASFVMNYKKGEMSHVSERKALSKVKEWESMSNKD